MSDKQNRIRREDIDLFNDLALQDNPNTDEVLDRYGLRGTMYEHRIKGVAGTRKAVGSIDIGGDVRERYLAERLDAVMRYVRPGYDTYEAALTGFNNAMESYASMQNAREEMMVGNFEGEIDRILTSRSDLKDKTDLNILLSMGAAHTTLRHKFTEAGFVSDQHFDTGGMYVYDHDTEMIRAYIYDKQPSPELIKKAFVNLIFNQMFYKLEASKDVAMSEWVTYERRVVDQLNDGQMEAIFELWNQDKQTLFDDVQNYLESQGIEIIPLSKEEIVEANKQAAEKQPRNLGRAATR